MGLDHDLEVQAGPSRRFGPLSSSDEWAGHIPMSASELTPRASGDPRAGPIEEIEAKPLLGWRERIRHFTWTWYTLVMATGGIANVIYACPLQFRGKYSIGATFMILNIVIFLLISVAMSLRFYHWPSTFKASFLHPTESLFVPAPVISVCVILITVVQYALLEHHTGPWLVTTMVILYWIYIAFAFLASVAIYLTIWSMQTHTMSEMTPVWIFPAYPLLLVGPLAGNLSIAATGVRAVEIIVGGVIVQGIGFMVSLMIYAAYISRLMLEKLPAETTRPSMFISVGPSGFTIAGIIRMGNNISNALGPTFMGGNGRLAGEVSQIIANWAGIWLWGLAVWFFFVSVGAHATTISKGRLHFAMTWNSFVFPNTGLALGTFAVAQALDNNKPIAIVGSILVCLLIATWIFVVSMMIRAIWLKHILWPERQEDRSEAGWKRDLKSAQMRNAGPTNDDAWVP